FSSRRRHTRFSRDWSSDVCSSDLITSAPEANSAATNSACGASPNPLVAGVPAAVSGGGGTGFTERPRDGRGRGIDGFFGERAMRSEERRVGKESGAGGARAGRGAQ